jgi:tRNA dimethylallyltransferase
MPHCPLDPERAALLHPMTPPASPARLKVRSTGHSLAHWQQRLEGGIGDSITLHPLVLLPDRDWLYERCDRRFGLMMEQGAVAEVEAFARGLDPDLPVMRAIGVAEMARFLRREADLDEAIAAGAGHAQLCQTPIHMAAPPAAARLMRNFDKISHESILKLYFTMNA